MLHTSSLFQEILNRQNKSFPPRRFRTCVLGSSELVERFQLKHKLQGHRGCVNSITFTDCGEYAVTGSDDTTIKIFDVESGLLKRNVPTMHTNNIFFAKDLPLSDCHEILSCAADGRVLITNIETTSTKQLHHHKGRAHRIAIVPSSPSQFYSCGEDGVCCMYDLRAASGSSSSSSSSSSAAPGNRHNSSSSLRSDDPEPTYGSERMTMNGDAVIMQTQFTTPRGRRCGAYCLGVNPAKPNEIAMGGSMQRVYVYDVRKFDEPAFQLCPTHLLDSSAHITGLRYDYSGNSIIASYNDDDVYRMEIDQHQRPCEKASPTENLPRSPRAALAAELADATAASPLRAEGSPLRTVDAEGSPLSRTATGSVSSSSTTTATNEGMSGGPGIGYCVRYTGHRNNDTVKQVAFMGTQSEFVVSGSDCGHIFIWDAYSGNIVNMLKGDEKGAVNCLAGHPQLPILASSGLESNAKLWAPLGERRPLSDTSSPQRERFDQVVQNNIRGRRDGLSQMGVPSSFLLRLLMSMNNDGDDDDSGVDSSSGGLGARVRNMSSRQLDALMTMLGQYTALSDEDDDDDEEDEDDDEEEDGDDDQCDDDDVDMEEDDEDEDEDEEEDDDASDGDNMDTDCNDDDDDDDDSSSRSSELASYDGEEEEEVEEEDGPNTSSGSEERRGSWSVTGGSTYQMSGSFNDTDDDDENDDGNNEYDMEEGEQVAQDEDEEEDGDDGQHNHEVVRDDDHNNDEVEEEEEDMIRGDDQQVDGDDVDKTADGGAANIVVEDSEEESESETNLCFENDGVFSDDDGVVDAESENSENDIEEEDGKAVLSRSTSSSNSTPPTDHLLLVPVVKDSWEDSDDDADDDDDDSDL